MAAAARRLLPHFSLPSLQPTRQRRALPPSCTHSERGVSFDPGSAFYRSDSAAGRDLAVLAATLNRRGRADPAAPPGADFVWANDASEALHPVILANLSRFEERAAAEPGRRRWVVSHNDATRLLAERYLRREYFDVIDVDSFGGDSAYVRAALLALKIGGLFYLTSTDWRSARGYGSRSNYGFISHCKSCGQSQTFGFDELGQITCGCTDRTVANEWGWAYTSENGVTLEKLLSTMIEESDPRLPPGYIRLDEVRLTAPYSFIQYSISATIDIPEEVVQKG
ncbi:hypothetical protein PR202_ga04321 [Eleusine coracana subsp. coracana]|uniref:Uncharacterized protein n=1 Tax=Eleusine coracana subsp. coracana TaxID=191504 RepID=A0AAV5BRH8_ELECO|nr:hypothetical protein PR202_ga04321 [Eleusine coracana subsp. coracana]